MSGNGNEDDIDELTRARMDIIGLKIAVQALTIYLANTRSKNNMRKGVLEVFDATMSAVDNIQFSDPTTATAWREEVKRSIHHTFDSLIAATK